jgi:hypothetical protein
MRRSYSISVHGDITVIDHPGQPNYADISLQYEDVVPARPPGTFARVEAVLSISDTGACSFTEPLTPAILLSVQELLDQAAADYLPTAVPPRRLLP